MAKQPKKTDRLEQERRQILKELAGDHGHMDEEEYRIGSFGCHELLDRTLLAAEFVQRQIQVHPACVLNKKWFALADRALTTLNDLYRQIAIEHLGKSIRSSTDHRDDAPRT